MSKATMNWLLCGAAAIGCAMPGLARAETATPAAAQDGSAPPAAEQTGLGDIVVTASKRAVNLQKESRTVAVVDSAALERAGLSDPSQIANLVSGLSIAKNGAQLQTYIRGVGDRTINNSTDPAVAYNFDGVYFPRTYEVTGSFYDLERIEVLKGPQGTLYGRNASAGAINLIAAKPRFETGGFVEGELGNYSSKRVTGALNLALSDTLAVRASGQIVDRDGYLTDGSNDEKTQAGRLQLLWKPSSADSLLLQASYAHLGGKGTEAALYPAIGDNPWLGLTDPEAIDIIKLTNPNTPNLLAKNQMQDIDTYLVSATYQHDFGPVVLTVVPAYLHSKYEVISAVGIAPIYGYATSNQESLEARLSSSSDSAIQWVVGGFASKEHVDDLAESNIGPFVNVNRAPKRDDVTYAAFGEVNASITDQFRVIGGIRYTNEQKTVEAYNARVFGATTFPLPSIPTTGTNASGERTDEAVNFRAGLEYDITPDSMIYGNVSTGFKAGGFFVAPSPNTYKPEKLTAYQGGIKNRFFDNRVLLNVEGFYWDYRNKQESFLSYIGSPPAPLLVTRNAGQATLYGVDVEAAFQITDNDRLSGDLEYLHTKYDSYQYTAVPPYGGACESTTSGSDLVVDCSGRPLVKSPKWSGRVSYQHTQPLGDGSELSFVAETRFSSSYFMQNDYIAAEHVDGYHVSNASLSWTTPSKKLTITAYIRNIENHAVYNGATYSPTIYSAGVGAIIDAPRTFGGRIRYNF